MTSLSLLPHTFTGLGLPCLRGHAGKMWPLWVGIYSVAIQAFVGRNGLFSKHCCLCWVTLFGRGFIMSQHTAGFMSIFAYTVNVGSSSNQDISIYIQIYKITHLRQKKNGCHIFVIGLFMGNFISSNRPAPGLDERVVRAGARAPISSTNISRLYIYIHIIYIHIIYTYIYIYIIIYI